MEVAYEENFYISGSCGYISPDRDLVYGYN